MRGCCRTPRVRTITPIRVVYRRGRPWNKGKTYTMASKATYANKGAWNKAMRRMYDEKCMHCGWDEAHCDTHHIEPRREGGEMSLVNGVILCPNCHRLADLGGFEKADLHAMRENAPVRAGVAGTPRPFEATA